MIKKEVVHALEHLNNNFNSLSYRQQELIDSFITYGAKYKHLSERQVDCILSIYSQYSYKETRIAPQPLIDRASQGSLCL